MLIILLQLVMSNYSISNNNNKKNRKYNIIQTVLITIVKDKIKILSIKNNNKKLILI